MSPAAWCAVGLSSCSHKRDLWLGSASTTPDGLLLRRHFHDDVSGTWTNPVTGAMASFSGGLRRSMTLPCPATC